MKFRQLEAFRCVMAAGSMKAAADMMHVTQPAVSRLIADLETHLGFRVFDRQKGTLKPTRQGLQFFDNVEEQFLGLERLENAAQQIRDEGLGLRLVATHTLAATLIPPVLARFRKRHPDCRVLLHSHRLAQVVVRVQSMAVDIAVAAQLPAMNNVRRRHIGTARQVCALPRGHPLCARAVIRPEDLEGEDIVSILPDGPAQWNTPTEMLRTAGVTTRQSYQIDTSLAAYAVVREGLALAIIEPFAARIWRYQGIEIRPFLPAVETTFHSATVMRSSFRPELEYFEKCLIEEARRCPELAQD
ncbi:LysR substrate-binding domain-containing protein [Pseudooceanicola aestuarii]|uniref:LysR substrate-binding domain-containing protein n=1 Tax=Pseudooceanicola aestuarii TaxID=2697319 RepID=UPI0013D12FDF|nr:LysR substrate-binding domain-containing protein [Pseudooceanicola aestuarii]